MRFLALGCSSGADMRFQGASWCALADNAMPEDATPLPNFTSISEVTIGRSFSRQGTIGRAPHFSMELFADAVTQGMACSCLVPGCTSGADMLCQGASWCAPADNALPEDAIPLTKCMGPGARTVCPLPSLDENSVPRISSECGVTWQ